MIRLTFAALGAFVLLAPIASAQESLTFEQHVRPILKAHCFDCHGDHAKLKGGLDLRLVRLMREGGDTGPAIDAADAKKSVLLEKLVSQEMPPGKKKLPAKDVALIERPGGDLPRAEEPTRRHDRPLRGTGDILPGAAEFECVSVRGVRSG